MTATSAIERSVPPACAWTDTDRYLGHGESRRSPLPRSARASGDSRCAGSGSRSSDGQHIASVADKPARQIMGIQVQAGRAGNSLPAGGSSCRTASGPGVRRRSRVAGADHHVRLGRSVHQADDVGRVVGEVGVHLHDQIRAGRPAPPRIPRDRPGPSPSAVARAPPRPRQARVASRGGPPRPTRRTRGGPPRSRPRGLPPPGRTGCIARMARSMTSGSSEAGMTTSHGRGRSRPAAGTARSGT